MTSWQEFAVTSDNYFKDLHGLPRHLASGLGDGEGGALPPPTPTPTSARSLALCGRTRCRGGGGGGSDGRRRAWGRCPGARCRDLRDETAAGATAYHHR
ncbi:unnamed protein product [Lampetra planeri]